MAEKTSNQCVTTGINYPPEKLAHLTQAKKLLTLTPKTQKVKANSLM